VSCLSAGLGTSAGSRRADIARKLGERANRKIALKSKGKNKNH